MGPGSSIPFRLAGLSLPARILLTSFIAIVGAGYLAAVANIYLSHRDADGRPGMTPDDIRAVYHGLERDAAAGGPPIPSPMLKAVRPEGFMRKQLEKGGEPAVRSLVGWLEAGARESDFVRAGVPSPGDPAPRDVIAARCVRCHNEATGKKSDVPYAKAEGSAPEYALVAKYAAPSPRSVAGKERIGPEPLARLVHMTHAHAISIPLFALVLGALFLLTGVSDRLKLLLGPLPMLAACADMASWWLARPFEPFVHVIALAGAVFGVSLGLQIACVLWSIWLERPRQAPVRGSLETVGS